MKDGDFVIFYVKNNEIYPVCISEEQNQMLQIFIPSVLGKKIQVLDKPQGEVVLLNKNNH